MKIPNIITIVRILLAPVFVLCFSVDAAWGKPAALGIAIAFEVTDLADGIIARRFGMVSDLGKFLDPAADSISRFTIFLCFAWGGYASVWAVAILFWRDSLVAMLRIMGATNDVIISARWSGKIKAWVQGTAAISILCWIVWPGIFGVGEENVPTVAHILMWITAGYTLYSLFDYFWGNRKVLAALDR
ncbi:MAG: CDP-diacylglycerol--glycerol-3-phosphate 3-phosphatidyltransferase [Planctomycetota bacterium]